VHFQATLSGMWYTKCLQTPLFIRPLTADERDTLEAGLHSAEAFTVRRCQILLASAEGQHSTTIARNLRCHDQTVRNAIRAFHQRGVSAFQPTSSRPHRPKAVFDTQRQERLRALLHQSPRLFGRSTSVWTLALAAEVKLCPGPDAAPGHWGGDSPGAQSVRGALEAGQTLDHQPRASLPQKTKRRDRLIRLAAEHPTWALGFADEVWWSRLAQPGQHRWGEAEAVTRLQELTRSKSDPDPNALACYGLLVRRLLPQAEQMLLRFVAGRPVSAVTTDFLAWCCDRLAEQGLTALLLIWDNTSWHTSQAVRTWIRTHNQRVTTTISV
jgi:transposase